MKEAWVSLMDGKGEVSVVKSDERNRDELD